MLYELGIKEEKTQIAGCVTVTDASGFGFKQVNYGVDVSKCFAESGFDP